MKLISENYEPYVINKRYDKEGNLIGSTTVLYEKEYLLTPEEVERYSGQKVSRRDESCE